MPAFCFDYGVITCFSSAVPSALGWCFIALPAGLFALSWIPEWSWGFCCKIRIHYRIFQDGITYFSCIKKSIEYQCVIYLMKYIIKIRNFDGKTSRQYSSTGRCWRELWVQGGL